MLGNRFSNGSNVLPTLFGFHHDDFLHQKFRLVISYVDIRGICYYCTVLFLSAELKKYKPLLFSSISLVLVLNFMGAFSGHKLNKVIFVN